jgi:hypothetical protein
VALIRESQGKFGEITSQEEEFLIFHFCAAISECFWGRILNGTSSITEQVGSDGNAANLYSRKVQEA